MQEIINCPSCQRKLQVPDTLMGQDVQCPTCGATFTARGDRPPPSPPPPPPPPPYQLQRETWHPPQGGPPPGPPGYGPDDYGRSGYGRQRHPGQVPHRGSTVLVLGILSLVLGPVGLVLGPIAWTMGTQDLNEIRAGRMDPEGEGTTNAGWICGMIGTILSIVLVAVFFLPFFCCGMFGARGWWF
jgi:hypothetical protein